MVLMSNIHVPFGLCEIIYDGVKLPSMADEGIFSAKPTYRTLFSGRGNATKSYMLESYDVTFTVPLDDESYNTLQMLSTLQQHNDGFYDNSSKVDTEGKRLVIHPHGVDGREFDICIWNAYISPETGFDRIYKKEVDSFEVKFIGQPSYHADSKLNNSYFFIGDWMKAGGLNADEDS